MKEGTLINEIMTRDVLTVNRDETIESVKNKMEVNHIHHLPVMSGKTMLGIISLGDIQMMQDHFTIFNAKTSEVINKKIFSTVLAHEIMTKNVVKVREDEPIRVAVDLFRQNLFRSLPVVDSHGHLTGMITPMDLIRYAYDDVKLI